MKPYFSTKNGMLFHGDCLEVMQQLDVKADLCLTDPPYGIGMDNSNKRTKPSRPNSYTMYADYRYKNADWDAAPISKKYFDMMFHKSINQIIWGANYYCAYLPNGNGWIFWDKMNGDDNCFSDGEFAFASKGVQSRRFVCSAFHGLKGGKDRQHPTQKPVALFKWCLEKYSKPNDLILDPFAGSGTTAVACELLSRRWILVEQDEDYCKIAAKRIKKASEQFGLFEGKV